MDPIEFENLKKSIHRLSKIEHKKRILLENVKSDLIIGKNNGIFEVTPALIQHVKIYHDLGYQYIILMDMNKNPIKIDNLKDFFEDLVEREHQVMNEYLIHFEELKDKCQKV